MTVSFRASTAALTTSAVNIIVLVIMRERGELGWLCLTSCGADVRVLLGLSAPLTYALRRSLLTLAPYSGPQEHTRNPAPQAVMRASIWARTAVSSRLFPRPTSHPISQVRRQYQERLRILHITLEEPRWIAVSWMCHCRIRRPNEVGSFRRSSHRKWPWIPGRYLNHRPQP